MTVTENVIFMLYCSEFKKGLNIQLTNITFSSVQVSLLISSLLNGQTSRLMKLRDIL